MLRLGRHRTAVATASGDGDQAAEMPYELASIVLLTMSGPRTGWIATEGERTSDWLNHGDELAIHALAEADVAGDPPDLSMAGVHRLSRADVIWAVPPPLPPNRHLRLHRRRVRVHLELEDHEITGQAHVRPGADATDQMLRGSRTMVPLTDVEVAPRDGSAERAFWPVLIVNTTHVRRMVNAVGEVAASPPPPSPSARISSVSEQSAQRPARTQPSSKVDRATIALRVLLDQGVIDRGEFDRMLARVAQ
jgi:hypothetical protein